MKQSKQYSIEYINETNNVRKFDCGNTSINNYLKVNALFDHPINTSTTMVITSQGSVDVIGYFSFLINSIEIEEHTKDIQCMSLEYFAIDKQFQNKRIGSKISGVIIINDIIPRLKETLKLGILVVEALTSKIGFYISNGFYILKKEHEKTYERNEKFKQTTIKMFKNIMDEYDKQWLDEHVNNP